MLAEPWFRAPHSLRAPRAGAWSLAGLVAAFSIGPVVMALAAAFGASDSFAHIASNLLTEYLVNTLMLMVFGAAAAAVVGTATAWLVASCRFPGSSVFGWALAMPLAMPAYVAAYAWGDMLGARGIWVAVLVYSGTLYPYVYLAARAAFAARSVCALEAARTLGAGPVRRFFGVALPMSRPAIAGGAALVALEIAADYGAADHLGVPTLGIGVFRAWFSMGDLAGAARVSIVLLVLVGLLVWMERSMRGRVGTSGGSLRWRPLTQTHLRGAAAIAASCFCLAVLGVGLLAPVWRLVTLAMESGMPGRDLLGPLASTASLTLAGVVFVVLLSAIGALLARESDGPARLVRGAALAGYATPGAVTALGVLALLTATGGASGALSGGLALAVLVLAYAARFMAAGLEPLSAGLQKVTRSQREASRSLGAGVWRRVVQIDMPIAAPSVLAAALIVAVEIAKELPATTILRPLGFDTLAVRAHAYASDERLAAAAWPALVIVAIALLPSLLLARGIDQARAGAR